ncbi:MAG: M20/M25/M40 family metallo-hydrolase, partial [Candidatus Methanomethyliaceae archaeon]
ILEFKPKIQRWDFATDGGYSMGVMGIPTVGFSPCEEELAHAPNESVSVNHMQKAAKVYAMMILMLCR